MGEDKNAASEEPWRNGGQQNGRISRLLTIRDFQKYSLPKAGVNSLKNQFCSLCIFHLFHSLFHSYLISGTETVPGVIVSCPDFTSSILAKIVLHILLLCWHQRLVLFLDQPSPPSPALTSLFVGRQGTKHTSLSFGNFMHFGQFLLDLIFGFPCRHPLYHLLAFCQHEVEGPLF